MDKRGFTLIELLITVAIIGILAGVAVTAYVGALKKAARSEAYTQLAALRMLEAIYLNREGGGTAYSPDAVHNADTSVYTIDDYLPAFQPGNDISFNYAITNDSQIVTPVAVPFATEASPAGTPCFVATATGRVGSRVVGDVFAIDCNNNKNY